MRISQTAITGCFSIDAEPMRDERGHFTRVFCVEELASAGIVFSCPQINLSGNAKRFTLRGLHYQDPPFAEAKFVRAVRGRAFDVVVDLRPSSASYKRWISIVLDSAAMNAVYVPEGCAHGFLTLEDDTDILYQMGRSFMPGKGLGIRWNDPSFAIDWPCLPTVISERDRTYPDFCG